MVTILKPQHACFVTNYVMYVGVRAPGRERERESMSVHSVPGLLELFPGL